MRFRIVLSRMADEDIDRNVTYIENRVSPLSAAKWHDGIHRRMQELAHRPGMWPLADEAGAVCLELREILYRHYRYIFRILFTIENDVVYIHRIWSASQTRLTLHDLE